MGHNIAVIASSTGGPKTLKELLTGMPRLNAMIVLVQHMPEFMNAKLCMHLATCGALDARLAGDGEIMKPGTIYVAPSDVHVEVAYNRRLLWNHGPKVNYVKPSADVAMRSLIQRPGDRLIGVVLTGMGKDGAAGISHIKSLGGITIAQDEKSSPIYGMPKEACETGDVDYMLDPGQIRSALVRIVGTIGG